MPSIKTVIFDLYGVLFFLKPSVILRQIGVMNTINFLCRYGMTPYSLYYIILDKMRTEMPGEFQKTIAYRGNFLPHSFCEWQRGKLTGKEVHAKIIEFIQTLDSQKFFKHRNDAQLVQSFFTQAFDSKSRVPAMHSNKKLIQTIHALKNDGQYNLIMLTNIDHELFEYLLKAFPDVFNLFDDIIASCKVELVKPQPEIFNYLLQKHHINAHECVFFDDQQENVDSAQSLGINSILYTKKLNVLSILYESN